MSSGNVDRNLLFGLLALQNDFVSREDLLAAVSVWLQDKSQALDEIMLARRALADDERQLISALCRKHLEKHAGSTQESLAALADLDGAQDELRKLGDAEVEATLGFVATVRPQVPTDPEKTVVFTGSNAPGQRFRVLRPHARGGLGEVFVAQDEELHREVALKQIQAEHADEPDSRARFVLEAEITGSLEHPGIVPVYGLGQYANGRPYYAMRFIRGDSLKEAVDRFHGGRCENPTGGQARGNTFNPVAFRKLLGRFVDVCNAMEYAHSRGVLHRDLKPGNVMLGSYGETLVVDWGVAKIQGRSDSTTYAGEQTLRPLSAAESSATQMGSAVGTPAFMSPEQAAGRLDELGPATDVYSLGATLYYVLTGRAPFDKDDVGATLRKVQLGEFLPPRAVNPATPRPLEAICLKAMALRPGDRYATPQSLADDVEKWLADEPVSTYVETPLELGSRWVRRHRSLVLGGAATVVLAIIGLVAFLAIIADANRRMSVANAELDQANRAVSEQNLELAAAGQREHEAKELAETRRREAERQAYSAAVTLAQREWDDARAGAARKLLAQCVPDLRSWDWHYLNRTSSRERLTLVSPRDDKESGSFYRRVAISPDGSLVATVGKAGHFAVWKTAPTLLVAVSESLSGADLIAVAFLPDASRFVTVDEAGAVVVRATVGGREERRLQIPTTSPVVAVSLSRQKNLLAAACFEEGVIVLDFETGDTVSRLHHRRFPMTFAAFSGDGAMLATVAQAPHDADRAETGVWSLETGTQLDKLELTGMLISSAAFSPDQRLIALGVGAVSLPAGGVRTSLDGGLLLWDRAGGTATLHKEQELGGEKGIFDVKFSPNGNAVALAAVDRRVILRDGQTGDSQFEILGHLHWVRDLAFTESGEILAAAGDGGVLLWNTTAPQAGHILRSDPTQRRRMYCAAISPDSRFVATGHPGYVQIWDLETSRRLRRIALESHLAIEVAYSPNGERLLVGTGAGRLIQLDPATGQTLFIIVSHPSGLSETAYSPRGDMVASTGNADDNSLPVEDRTYTIRLWNAANGEPLKTLAAKGGLCMTLRFSPDGKRLAAANRKVRVWEVASGRESLTIEVPPDATSVAFDPAGKKLVVCTANFKLLTFDAHSGQPLKTLHTGRQNLCDAVFSGDGKRVANVDLLGRTNIIDVETGDHLLSLLSPAPARVIGRSLQFSADGRYLLLPTNQACYLWDAGRGFP